MHINGLVVISLLGFNLERPRSDLMFRCTSRKKKVPKVLMTLCAFGE